LIGVCEPPVTGPKREGSWRFPVVLAIRAENRFISRRVSRSFTQRASIRNPARRFVTAL
jgi:hypothetical protein